MSSSATTTPAPDEALGPRAISQYFSQLADSVGHAIEEINEINADTQLLALNARIEAAHAGSSGAAFGIVAQEMQALGKKTSDVAMGLARSSKDTISLLTEVIGNSVRGGRLADMALTNVDLIDRNLYERTCDVRWWATDSSIVDALADPSTERLAHASHRMGVILSAYTVYHDLVLCDMSGAVVANGRPDLYSSVGYSAKHMSWFTEAARSRSGNEFGFESATRSAFVDGQSVLVYSCGVRAGGQADGQLLGVLGVLFNWETFAQTIVAQTPLIESERADTRVAIIDDAGRVLADSWGRQLDDRLTLPASVDLQAHAKHFTTAEHDGRKCCIAYAKAPGFETYSTGWRSVIIQPAE
jgi:hypothetical protein